MIAKLANFMFHEQPKNKIHFFTVVLYYDAMCDSDVAIFQFIIYYVMKYRKILIKYNAYISQL